MVCVFVKNKRVYIHVGLYMLYIRAWIHDAFIKTILKNWTINMLITVIININIFAKHFTYIIFNNSKVQNDDETQMIY